MTVSADQDLARSARRVFGALAGWDPGAVRALAVSLGMSPQPLRQLAQPFGYYADVLAHPSDGRLALLAMRRALRLMRLHPDIDELVERLEGVDEPPWPQLRAALTA